MSIEQTHNPASYTESLGTHTLRLWFPKLGDPTVIASGQFIVSCWVWRCEKCNKSWPYGYSDTIQRTPCGFVDEGIGI